MLRWFIGFDEQEIAPYHVLSHSIISNSSMPVSITPVRLENLQGIFTRPRHDMQSTDFAFSRFMVPWMCNYEGWAVFSDCDMIVMDDPAKLWAWRDDRFSVMCVHHNHIPTEDVKFLGQKQTKYDRKNWSSVMLFNNDRCRALTPEYVNSASGLELHQFKWLKDDQIGYIPREWNYLVGSSDFDEPKLVHYTLGGPYFDAYKDCEYNEAWKNEFYEATSVNESRSRIRANKPA